MKDSTIGYREIFRLSLPIIASSAVENITAIINTAFLGHVGAVALGASAVGGIFYLALIMLAFGFGIGVQIIVARRYGEKKIPQIGQTIQQSLLFLVGWGIVLTLVLHFWGIHFFRHFVRSDEIFHGVRDYLSFRIWGLVLAYINIIFRAFYTGIMRTRVVGYYSLILAATNIFFDYVLIFGKMGFPRMEIAGAGLASVIAEGVATLFFIVYTMNQKNIREFALTRKHTFDWKEMIHTLRIASPVMLQFAFSFGGWFLFFMFVEKMGEIPLAVSNLVRTFYLIALLPLWGHASATNTLVSYLMGSGRVAELTATIRKILALSVGSITCLVLVLTVFDCPFTADCIYNRGHFYSGITKHYSVQYHIRCGENPYYFGNRRGSYVYLRIMGLCSSLLVARYGYHDMAIGAMVRYFYGVICRQLS